MGIVRTRLAVACAVLFEAARDFAAPFGLRGVFKWRFARGDGLKGFLVFSERNFAEGAVLVVVHQQCPTLRADSYHWSVLRCGDSSVGTLRIIARPDCANARP